MDKEESSDDQSISYNETDPTLQILEDDWEIVIEKSFEEKSINFLKIIIHLQLLDNSNWFSGSQSHPHIIYAQPTQPSFIPDITSICNKEWKAEIRDQENVNPQSRLNMLNPDQQNIISKVNTLTTYDIKNILNLKSENIIQLYLL